MRRCLLPHGAVGPVMTAAAWSEGSFQSEQVPTRGSSPGTPKPPPSSCPGSLECLGRLVESLSARFQRLEVEHAALRGCLEELGLLSLEAVDVRVHKTNFAAARHAHPCSWEATLTDVLMTRETRELMLQTARCAGPLAARTLGASCRSSAGAVELALAGLGNLAPRALYVCGGRDGQRCLNSVERLDPSTGKWEYVPEMLQHRAAAVAAELNGQLYVCGGWSGQQYLNSVEAFDPSNSTWNEVASMSQRAAAAAASVLQGRLYVGGGWDGTEALNSVECFDPALGCWEMVASMTQRRHGAAAVRAAGHLYICGGHDNRQALSSVERYDPASNRWEVLASMTEPRHGATAALIVRRLYVCGGHNGHQALSSAEFLNLSVGEWRPISPMVQRREGAGAAALAGTLYVCGGLDGRRWAVQSAECFDPAGSKWETVGQMETRRAFVAAAPAPL